MTEKEQRIKQILASFENGKMTGEAAIKQLQDVTGKAVEIACLNSFWESESADAFIQKLLIEPLIDWENIDDNQALELLTEIFENITDDAIIERNSEALEKRYGKPAGFVADKIFQESIEDPNELLQELKKDTTIYL